MQGQLPDIWGEGPFPQAWSTNHPFIHYLQINSVNVQGFLPSNLESNYYKSYFMSYCRIFYQVRNLFFPSTMII